MSIANLLYAKVIQFVCSYRCIKDTDVVSKVNGV